MIQASPIQAGSLTHVASLQGFCFSGTLRCLPLRCLPHWAAGLLLTLLILFSGCTSTRNSHQYEVDAMRAEYFELEDRYYEAIGRLEAAERQLNRRSAADEYSEDPATSDPMPGVEPEGPVGDGVTPMPQELPEPMPQDLIDNLPGPDQSRRTIGSGIRSANRNRIRSSNATPPPSRSATSLPPNSVQRNFRDPVETVQERNSRHAADAAAAGVPYYPAPNDERDLLASDVSTGGEDEIGWQEPSIDDGAPIEDWEIAEVTIDRRRTSGFDQDSDGQDDGIVLILMPRNSQHQTLPVFAPLTIALLDPAERGEEQRLGLWEFTADEVALRQPPTAQPTQGIVLRLPWPQGTPRHDQLALFVRYELPNGERLETRADVTIKGSAASGDRSAWSARPTPLRSAAGSLSPNGSSPAAVPSPNPSYAPVRRVSDPTPAPRSGSSGTNSANSSPPVPRTSRPSWSPYR